LCETLRVAARAFAAEGGDERDAVGALHSDMYGAQIPRVTVLHLGARGEERLCGGVGAGQSHNLAPRSEQLGHDGCADETGRAGDGHTPKKSSSLGANVRPGSLITRAVHTLMARRDRG